MKKALFFFILLLVAFKALAQSDLDLVPYPNKIIKKQGAFLSKEIKIKSDDRLLFEQATLINFLNNSGFNATLVKEEQSNLELNVDETLSNVLGSEGYRLKVTAQKISLLSATSKGIFYGIQTLKQLKSLNANFPEIEIEDKPKFEWRAFMLDESRHFMGKEVVFNLLDEMSVLKMNKFHWHLTDDQGWRIEIKKYPLLTQIGGKREDTQINGIGSSDRRGKSHQGFYSQSEIKEIISYAQKRHITIVPEIEMPGHASAAIAAYPWLGTLKHKINVPETFGILPNTYNVSNPKVQTFMEDVLLEVMDLFPGKVIHIGGDEVLFDQWEKDKGIKNYMKKNSLKSYADVQLFFTNKIADFISKNNHRMMGWNDILGGNIHHWEKNVKVETNQKLPKNAIIHFWKGSTDLMISALEKGHHVVNSQHDYTYLDYDVNSLTLKKGYDFSPIPNKLDKELSKRVLGLGCQLWTEWVPNKNILKRQVFPRIASYAEVGWTNTENKDFKRFYTSLRKINRDWFEKDENANLLDASNIYVHFNVDMNSEIHQNIIKSGKKEITIAGTFLNSITGAKEHWHANGITLTDYDEDGIYTGKKIVKKNSSFLFVLLASPDGNWKNHVKFLGDKSCPLVTNDGNYEVFTKSSDITISFKAGRCLSVER
jgi:hexosaminidase